MPPRKATRNATTTPRKAQVARKRTPQARQDARSSLGPGDLTPPSSGSQRKDREDVVPTMLMSPPPEETLRTSRNKITSGESSSAGQHNDAELNDAPSTLTSKRKRNLSVTKASDARVDSLVASSSRVTLDNTPHPKPRKQSKLHVSFIEKQISPAHTPTKPSRIRASASPTKRSLVLSPHANNPQADYIPLLPSPTRQHLTHHRRSATPVPYEPPAERFTPPREIFTPIPSISKSSKRKSMPKSSVKIKGLTLQIKKEPPDINLDEPPPPPSPTDDPLLLKGPPPSARRKPRAPRASLASIPSVHSRDTPPISSSSPIRAPEDDGLPIQDLNFASMDVDSDNDDGPLPALFNFNQPPQPIQEDEWTDEEQDGVTEFDHAGEYTGKFKIITVPTKQDPPSSTTRRRQDMWGRPISPFPYEKMHPSTAARRHSPIPESPTREGQDEDEERELPVAEYDDEVLDPGPSRWRSPSPPRLGSPLPPDVDDGDVVMEEAAADGSSLPSSSPRRSSSPLPDEAAEEPVAGSSGHRHTPTPEPEEGAVSVVVEADVDVDLHAPEEHLESPAHGDLSGEEDIVDEHAKEEPAPGDPDARPQDSRSQLSYVGPADLPLATHSVPEDRAPTVYPSPTGAAVSRASVEEPFTAHSQLSRKCDSFDVPVRDLDFEAGHPSSVRHADQTADSRFDFGSGSESSEEPEEEPETQPTEWSFGVPQEHDDQDEVMVEAEEEDAASVVRELSREPEEHDEIRPPLQPESEPQERQMPVAPVKKPAPDVSEMAKPPDEAATVQEELPASVVREPSTRWSRLGHTGPSVSGPAPAPISKLVPLPIPAPLPAPAPPPTPRVPELAFSPRNPFQTPGSAQTGSPRRQTVTKEFHPLQTAPTPQFDLPEDDADESLLDPGIVKITSSDPMAAARAAAILRLHKYDCVETIGSPRRDPNASLESAMKSARLKSVLQSGINKSFAQRSTLGGVIENSSITGGVTLTELLKEAEATILLEESMLHELSPPKAARASASFAKPSAPLKTPAHTSPKNSRFEAARSIFDTPAGPRPWAKADWKTLDTCYTDERLVLAQRAGLGDGALPLAEDVNEEQVLERFIERMGGMKVVHVLGDAWSRDNLLKRIRALRRKQSAVNFAPPGRQSGVATRDLRTPAQQNYSTFFSPSASVLAEAAKPAPPPLTVDPSAPALSGDVRYAELLKEAVQGEKDEADITPNDVSDPDVSVADEADTSLKESSKSFLSPLLPGRAAHSLATKVKGLVLSYLRSPKTVPAKEKTGKPAVNGPVLPVPPSEVFKKPRPPITTPVSKPVEKPAPPKDLIQLHPVPPPKSSMIPRPTQKSQKWVELNHVQPRPSSAMSANSTVLRERRDSGASVKDLVQTFEKLDKATAAEREAQKRLELLKKKQRIKKWTDSRTAKNSKPAWR